MIVWLFERHGISKNKLKYLKMEMIVIKSILQ